ncbi:hypothetical protein HPP92_020262 [Vanilla planifolia]|uniref:Uncharacterized protein n=1 Tax=Vanilla planifolia TaxID=51239 RepID=A0A835Q838_VANPL|nr:hypothetical protein HPP92_020262 [Vanilla planifolia]
MEWDLKMPPWDFPELDQNACQSNLSSVVGSSGALDGSVDLKLGDLGLAATWGAERSLGGVGAAAIAGTRHGEAAAAAAGRRRPERFVPGGWLQKRSEQLQGVSQAAQSLRGAFENSHCVGWWPRTEILSTM